MRTVRSAGRGDSIISFDQGRAAAARIPNATFVPLESRNHILLSTEPAWQQFVSAVNEFLPLQPERSPDILAALDVLSAREKQVLELVAQGLNNPTIANLLNISERTARNHVSTILSKLGVSSRAQVIVRAREAGFGQKVSK